MLNYPIAFCTTCEHSGKKDASRKKLIHVYSICTIYAWISPDLYFVSPGIPGPFPKIHPTGRVTEGGSGPPQSRPWCSRFGSGLCWWFWGTPWSGLCDGCGSSTISHCWWRLQTWSSLGFLRSLESCFWKTNFNTDSNKLEVFYHDIFPVKY